MRLKLSSVSAVWLYFCCCCSSLWCGDVFIAVAALLFQILVLFADAVELHLHSGDVFGVVTVLFLISVSFVAVAVELHLNFVDV